MRIIGSQRRESLKESGYTLVSRPSPGVVRLRPASPLAPDELWYANDHHAGYTIQVGRWGYEFGCDVKGGAK